MGGYRHRNMYYLTGLPGWMRFGFSPGWIGRSPYGLGPAAQYLLAGTWPASKVQTAWQSRGFSPPGFATPYDPWGVGEISKEEELRLLQGQAEILEDELDGIRRRIEELEGGGI